MANKTAARQVTIEYEGSLCPNITQFGAFGSSRGQIDATSYNEDWASFVTGVQEGDELPIVLAYDPDDATHQAIDDQYNTSSDTPVTWTVTHIPTGAAWDVTTVLTALSRGGQLGELFAMNVTAKIVEPGVVQTAS